MCAPSAYYILCRHKGGILSEYYKSGLNRRFPTLCAVLILKVYSYYVVVFRRLNRNFEPTLKGGAGRLFSIFSHGLRSWLVVANCVARLSFANLSPFSALTILQNRSYIYDCMTFSVKNKYNFLRSKSQNRTPFWLIR